MAAKHMVTTSLLLGVFAIVGTFMVALTFEGTEEKIADNEYQALLRSLNALVPAESHDNDITNDTIEVTSKPLLGNKKPHTIYRARMKGKPVAAVISTIAPDGYNGAIMMLVAIRHDGTIGGVRVVNHRETPGLGDGIEVERSDWIRSFDNLTLHNPDELGWHVKKDGGIFDQFTGATITPRAVVKAVHNALKYFEQNRDKIFEPSNKSDKTDGQ